MNIQNPVYSWIVDLIQIYQCFCDATRLRIIHLLTHGPLCVCHFQEVLDLPQVKVSQQLAYLRKHGMVECERHGHWMIYSLPAVRTAELESNLKCLQDCVQTDERFRADLENLRRIEGACGWVEGALRAKNRCGC